MCTILALHRVHPEFPLVVAANRDEFYARAATGPRALSDAPRVVGGMDEKSGGTWLGATARGLFVGLTNQRSYHRADPGLRSRGAVVLACLRAGSVEGVEAVLRALDPGDYNAFNLLFGDGRALRVAYARPAGVTIEPLGEGLHVLANDRMGSPAFPKVPRAVALASPVMTRRWPALVDGLARVLGDHAKPPLDAVPPAPKGALAPRVFLRELQALCIHTPVYGTRSATILGLGDGRVGHYLFAPGAPCETPFTDVTPLARPPL